MMSGLANLIVSRFPATGSLVGQLKSPLVFNGYALVLGSGTASVLGMVYWILAARLYAPEVVGLNSAAISAMFFLTNVAQLNLVHALNRFVPAAGEKTARLVLGAYLVSATLALGVSAIFLFGVSFWSPSLHSLSASPGTALWFVVATVSWCLFTLQDGVLVGLRQAKWVPLSTIVYAITKLGLIALFAALFPQSGVLMSWTVPVLLLVVPVNVLIFTRLIPNHVETTRGIQENVSVRDIFYFVAGNYLSSFIWIATVTLLPLIILERAGAASTAHFYLSWNIAYALYFISTNMGMSLVTEGSRNPQELAHYSLQTLKQTLGLIVPAVVLIVVLAPYILRLYGPNYATEAVSLLRLLTLSAIPYVFVVVHNSVARVRRKVLNILLVYGALCTVVLGCSYLLLSSHGIQGVGVAWLLGQSLVAGTLLLTELRQLWSPHLRLPSNFTVLSTLFRMVSEPLLRRRYTRRAEKLLSGAAEQFRGQGGHYNAPAWRVARTIPNLGGIRVLSLAPAGGDEAAILKLSTSPRALKRLERSLQVLSALQKVPALGAWRELLPTILAAELTSRSPYTVETLLSGTQAERFLQDPATRHATLEAAVGAISELHRQTARDTQIDHALLNTWVDAPLVRLVHLFPKGSPKRETLEQLGLELREALLRRAARVGWTHGDYTPQNILLSEDGSAVTGIIDWERASAEQLPSLDVMHLLISTRMLVEAKELGEVICALLGNAPLSAFEASLIAKTCPPGYPMPSVRTLVLLVWLKHTSTSLNYYANNPLWLGKVVERVLACLARYGDRP